MHRIGGSGLNSDFAATFQAGDGTRSSTTPGTAAAVHAPQRPEQPPMSRLEAFEYICHSLKHWSDGSATAKEVSDRIKLAFACDYPRLDLSNLNLDMRLPDCIGQLKSLERLELAGNKLTAQHIPATLENLDRLEFLDLSHNRLERIPEGVAQLHRLQLLSLSSNALTELPATLGSLPELHTLLVSGNPLQALPPQIFLCRNLRTLCADNCGLQALPLNIGVAGNLRVLALSTNDIREFPLSFHALSNAMVAITSGNPLSAATRIRLLERESPSHANRNLAPRQLAELANVLSLPDDAPELSDFSTPEVMGVHPLPRTLIEALAQAFRGQQLNDAHPAWARLRVLAPAELAAGILPDSAMDAGGTQVSPLQAMAMNAGNTPERAVLLAIKPDAMPLHRDFQKLAHDDMKAKDPTLTDKDMPPVPLPQRFIHSMFDRFSTFELLSGVCRLAMRMRPGDPALSRVETIAQQLLAKLGAGPFDTQTMREYFGRREHRLPLAMEGHWALAVLADNASVVVDNPRFGARGYFMDLCNARQALMPALAELQRSAIEVARHKPAMSPFELGLEREMSLPQRLMGALNIGQEREHAEAHEREPVPILLSPDSGNVSLLSHRRTERLS